MSYLFLSGQVNYPFVHHWRIGACVALFLFLIPGSSTIAYAQTDACTDLIADSGFESGQGWVIKSHGNYSVLSDAQAHTGSQSAYLAGMNNANDLLLTKLTLPAAQQSLSLNFWWKVNSEDTRDLNDLLSVQVADGAGKGRQTLLTLGSDRASNRWHQSTLDLSSFTGQTIQLQFAAKTDETNITDFFVDDVEVTGCDAG